MSFLERPDNMFAVDDDGTLVIERGYGFRVERFGDGLNAGDLIHCEAGKHHHVWQLTGERDSYGSLSRRLARLMCRRFHGVTDTQEKL